MPKVPILIDLPAYSQAEETSLATAWAGKPASLYSVIFNTTLNKERSWNGTAFVNTNPPTSGTGIGYNTGDGGSVTQATSRTTGVTLNKLCGNITMFSAAQAANALVTFTLTNSFITATDFVLVQHISATNGGAWVFSVVAGAGSCTISIANSTAASITSATPLRFTIIKGATT